VLLQCDSQGWTDSATHPLSYRWPMMHSIEKLHPILFYKVYSYQNNRPPTEWFYSFVPKWQYPSIVYLPLPIIESHLPIAVKYPQHKPSLLFRSGKLLSHILRPGLYPFPGIHRHMLLSNLYTLLLVLTYRYHLKYGKQQ